MTATSKRRETPPASTLRTSWRRELRGLREDAAGRLQQALEQGLGRAEAGGA